MLSRSWQEHVTKLRGKELSRCCQDVMRRHQEALRSIKKGLRSHFKMLQTFQDNMAIGALPRQTQHVATFQWISYDCWQQWQWQQWCTCVELATTNAWRYYVILRNNLRWIFAGFLIASWQLLDIFLGLLDDSWKLLPGSWQLFPLPNCQVYSRYTKKPLRHRQEANETQTRLLRYRQEVTRYVKSSRSDKICQIVTNIFEIFKKNLGASRFIKNCQEVSGSVKKLFEKSPRRY